MWPQIVNHKICSGLDVGFWLHEWRLFFSLYLLLTYSQCCMPEGHSFSKMSSAFDFQIPLELTVCCRRMVHQCCF